MRYKVCLFLVQFLLLSPMVTGQNYCFAAYCARNSNPLQSSITGQSVADDCAYTFFPDATWAANHPGCVPDVQWVGNCVPTCTLSDCVPGDGDVEIGTIKLTFDGTVYRVYIIDGGVITVLVEDF